MVKRDKEEKEYRVTLGEDTGGAVQRDDDAIRIRLAEVGQRLPFANGRLEHPVDTLAGALDESGLRQRLREQPVARHLPEQDVVGRHARGEAAGTLDLDAFAELPDEHGARGAIVAMRDRVEDCLTHRQLIESGDVEHEQTVPKVLSCVAEVHQLPEVIEDQERAAAKLAPVVVSAKTRGRLTTRALAEATRISKSSVQRYLKIFNLKPHRVETFKLSTDPAFAERLHDIVGLYVDPPAHAVVLSVDEKSQIQALDRDAAGPADEEGARRNHDA